MRVVICIATFKRPDGLAHLLRGIGDLAPTRPPVDLRIVVVDNDPSGSAESICQNAATRLSYDIQYAVEPRQGIAIVRNKALDMVGPNADWIAFLDDDECPEPQWLAVLLAVQAEYSADVVAGPVLPRFTQPVPAWIVDGCFFDRRRHVTGQPLTHAFTGNVLFRAALCRERGLRFDERFALTGGEDRHFFRRVGMAGGRIVWADEAIVYESVPPDRANKAWLVRRQLRAGSATSIIERDLRGSPATWLELVGKGMAWLGIGAVQMLVGVIRGYRFRVAASRSMAYGAGLLAGAVGRRVEEYGPAAPP